MAMLNIKTEILLVILYVKMENGETATITSLAEHIIIKSLSSQSQFSS